ncbi:MAG: hypothetical protein RIT42_1454 [Bacteroidota bacterium]
MRKNFSISLICLLLTQSGLQAGVDVQHADSVTVREALNQSAQTHQFNTKYIPPALSLERKSLRIINMQGAAGLPKGEWEMFIQHRFGTFGTGAYNWYGLDQSYMRIGLDAGLSERLTVGVSRSSMNKIADGYFKYQFKGKATRSADKETSDNKSEVTAAWYSNVSINTQARANISQEPFYYTNRLRFVNTIIISKNINDRLLIALTPSLVHVNLVDLATESNDIAVMGAYGRMKFSDRYAVTAEIQKPFLSSMPAPSGVMKTVNIPTDPYMALGFEIYTAKHVFQLSVSNAQSMNESYYMTQNNGSFEPSNLRFGFNIVRRW